MRPLKIAIISFDWRNIFETDFSQLEDKLRRDGLAPEINYLFLISWSTKSYYKKIGNIQTIHLRMPYWFRFFCYFLSIFIIPIALKVKSFKPDIILVFDFPLIFSGIFPKIFWRSKIILFLGNLPLGLIKIRKLANLRHFYHIMAGFLGKHLVTQFFAISQATKNYIENLGVASNKIKIFTPNTIERDKHFILSSKKGLTRQIYNIPPSKKILLSVGRLEAEKGFADLIKLFHLLGRDDLVLIIVGEGSQKNSLIKLVNNLKIERKVIFTGYVGRKKIWNYYQDADIFILLSHSEGLGLVFWEAMFVGTPVIGTPIDGIKETIGNDGGRGFYWKNDLEDLKNKIDFCLDNANKDRVSMIGHAKEYVQQKFKSKANINDFFGF